MHLSVQRVDLAYTPKTSRIVAPPVYEKQSPPPRMVDCSSPNLLLTERSIAAGEFVMAAGVIAWNGTARVPD